MIDANPVNPVRKQVDPLTDQDSSPRDALGLYTPDIIADDCSSVFLVVNYQM
jgi:hypothetical protein